LRELIAVLSRCCSSSMSRNADIMKWPCNGNRCVSRRDLDFDDSPATTLSTFLAITLSAVLIAVPFMSVEGDCSTWLTIGTEHCATILHITRWHGSARVITTMLKVNAKPQNSTPRHPKTPEPMATNIGHPDIYPYAKLHHNLIRGFCPHICKAAYQMFTWLVFWGERVLPTRYLL